MAAAKASTVAKQDLLATVLEAMPFALVLFGDDGRIVFTNTSARELFFAGAGVEGQNFIAMLERAPLPIRHALQVEDDTLAVLESDGDSDTYFVSKRILEANGRRYVLVVVKPVTEPVARQEIATLRRIIRVIGHEVNNSLGPIASLMGTARTILPRPEHHGRLATVFETVEERANHLQRFLAGYGELAKLAPPKPALVEWQPFLTELATLWPQVRVGPPPAGPGYFDRAQIQQVIINLVKNAVEAGGPENEVVVQVERPTEGGSRVTVLDRGSGMSDEVMRNALLPFVTTKPNGTGLGLALCREILDQHRARLRLARRAEGGMAISFWLPDRERPLPTVSDRSRVLLTLTRT